MIRYMFKNKLLFISSIIFIFLESLTGISKAFLFKYIVDTAVNRRMNVFYKTVIISVLFACMTFIVQYLTKIVKAKFTKNIMLDLKNDIFSGIINNDISSNENSKYISSLTNDMNTIENDFYNSFLILISQLSLFIFALISFININIYMMLIIMIFGWLPIIFTEILSKDIKKNKKISSDNLSNYTKKIKDFFSGFEIIKSFGIEKETRMEFEKYNNLVENSKYKCTSKIALSNSLSSFLGYMLFVVI